MSELEYREEAYGEEILVVEPGGVEAIPDRDRHGKAWNLFAVWTSPNLEFATIYVGALGMWFFGLSLTQAILGILLGNGLGALSQYFLTQDGPRYGVPQMILSRVPFGKAGNIFPAMFNSVAAGIGWFAVNSISGALALHTITKLSTTLSLIIVALAQVTIAFVGHNLVQTVEKYLMPYLIVVFGIAAIVILTKPSVAPTPQSVPGGFWLYLGAIYGYSAGWNPFASDYARYLPKSVNPKEAGRFAALGLIVAPSILEIVGLLAVRAGMGFITPTDDFKLLLGGTLGTLVLLGVVLGSICANVLNVYSGSISFLTMGIKMKTHHLRAVMAVVWGVLGYYVATQFIDDLSKIENFLLVMAYWIGPWLGVVFADRIRRAGTDVSGLLFARRGNFAGPFAFIVSMAASVYLFSNQQQYKGYFPTHYPQLGDIAFFVGFALAFAIYWLLFPVGEAHDRASRKYVEQNGTQLQ